jgi:hypothetical protein
MIGLLPKSLTVNSVQRAIRSDFRTALLIFQAFNDPELSEQEKVIVMLDCLYEDEIPYSDIQEAIEKAIWFLDGGQISDNNKQSVKVLDWEQDEQIIFSAVNKVAGKETRAVEYLHWWTFLGYFNEIGEGLLSTVINIRQKKAKKKKLEKYEQEFYREHKELIKFKVKLSDEEQAEIDRINKLIG